MSQIHKQYHPHPSGEGEIKMSIYYRKGQGYVANVIPVKRTARDGYSIEESGCFTGFNQMLLEVTRASAKREAEAIAILQSKVNDYLNYFKPVEA